MEQSGLFQFLMDNAMEIVLVFNGIGKIVYANQTAEKLLEYNKELTGCLISDIFPGAFVI